MLELKIKVEVLVAYNNSELPEQWETINTPSPPLLPPDTHFSRLETNKMKLND